jgi:hypothetical protein
VVGLPAFTPQESADPSVAVVAMLEGQALNGVAHPVSSWRGGGTIAAISQQ